MQKILKFLNDNLGTILTVAVLITIFSFFWHVSDTRMNQYDQRYSTCYEVWDDASNSDSAQAGASLDQTQYPDFMIACLKETK